MTLYDEALPLCRRLAESLPHSYGAELPYVLNNVAQCLMALDEPRQASDVADEAVAICRRLVADERAHLAMLVGCLLGQSAVSLATSETICCSIAGL